MSILLFSAISNLQLYSQVLPAHIFDNNMVLQRGKPVRIWGTAQSREKIKVEFAGQIKTTTADDQGNWIVFLDPMTASSEPRVMKVSARSGNVSFSNVLVGDLWVLGGQSNMEFDLARIFHGDVEILSAHYQGIRLMTLPSSANLEPKKDFDRINEYDSWYDRFDKKGYWFICSPETVPTFSGLGYVFGRRLYTASQVPIGLIDVSLGGTTVEAWLKPETLAKMAENRLLLKQWNDKVVAWDSASSAPNPLYDRNFPGSSYTGMIAPIAGMTVKGIIFHQGYNNALEDARPDLYSLNFQTLIQDWRDAFMDPELPFGIIELSAGGEPQTLDNYELRMIDPAPAIREGQLKAFLDIKNTGFASAYDQQVNWYHPQKKVELGERMARWALKTQYGFDITWEPSRILKTEIVGDSLVVTFSKEVKTSDDRPIEGFCLSGPDHHFYPSKASYWSYLDEKGQKVDDKTKVVVWNRLVDNPVALRYAWARNPLGNLVNQDCPLIPVPLYRSDSWNYPEAPFEPDAYAVHRTNLRAMRKIALEQARDRIQREKE